MKAVADLFMGSFEMEMGEIRLEWLDAIIHLLYPRRCAVCDKLLSPEDINAEGGFLQHRKYIHKTCAKHLHWVGEPVCMHCGSPLKRASQEYCYDCNRRYQRRFSPDWDGGSFSNFTQGKALFLYEGAMKRTMYRFKYRNRREYADFFAAAACDKWADWIRKCGVEAVVPIPMHRSKQRHRGYNQAALLARKIAARMELAYAPRLVSRVRNTKPQKCLNDVERKNNLKNAFQTTHFIVQYKRVLLVDDIYTTGSTAEAVAEELHRAGVQEVYVLAMCIGMGL